MVLIFLLFSLFAQEKVTPSFKKNTFIHYGSLFSKEFFSPFLYPGIRMMFFGGVLSGVSYGLEQEFHNDLRNISKRSPLKGSASSLMYKLGKGYPNFIYSIGYLISWGFTKNKEDLQRSFGMFRATVYSALWSQIFKSLIKEERPRKNKDFKSFPSGHATAAFTFAGFITSEHRWYWGLSAVGIGVLTAYGRIHENAHHLHDLMFGATLGFTYGYMLSDLYKNKKEAPKFMAIPDIQPNKYGVSIFYSF